MHLQAIADKARLVLTLISGEWSRKYLCRPLGDSSVSDQHCFGCRHYLVFRPDDVPSGKAVSCTMLSHLMRQEVVVNVQTAVLAINVVYDYAVQVAWHIPWIE